MALGRNRCDSLSPAVRVGRTRRCRARCPAALELLIVALLAPFHPGGAAAQQALGYTVAELSEILDAREAPGRLVNLVVASCVDDGASAASQQMLAAAGAPIELRRAAERFTCVASSTFRLVDIAFFERGEEEQGSDQQLYATRFDRRYMRALGIVASFRRGAGGAHTPIPVTCRAQGAGTYFEGSAMAEPDPSWLDMELLVLNGWDSIQMGLWDPGVYAVTCMAGGQTLTRTFEAAEAQEDPTVVARGLKVLGILCGSVTDVLGTGLAFRWPVTTRLGVDVILSATREAVGKEVSGLCVFSHPSWTAGVGAIAHETITENKAETGVAVLAFSPEPSDMPGDWPPGRVEVDCTIGATRLPVGFFEIIVNP